MGSQFPSQPKDESVYVKQISWLQLQINNDACVWVLGGGGAEEGRNQYINQIPQPSPEQKIKWIMDIGNSQLGCIHMCEQFVAIYIKINIFSAFHIPLFPV